MARPPGLVELAADVDAVVRAAHGLGMTTVAEHVSRAALMPVLADLGVDRLQGFHIGRPVPLADLLAGQGLRAVPGTG